MEEFFNKIVSNGATAIESLIDDRQQENVELEFKTKARPETGELNKEDRRNLAVALSAFANSMGGLVIWGVEARKNSDNVDCAAAPVPINEIERFKNEVERAVSQAIMPRHEGIRIAAIPTSGGAGYLAMHIERSERRPHRAEFGDKQYFKRVGDSSIAMEHYDIEDSFNRKAVARLKASVRLVQWRGEGIFGIVPEVQIHFDLTNDSGVSARFPYFILDDWEGMNLVPSKAELITPNWRRFDGGADVAVHPGMTIKTMSVAVEVMLRRGGVLPPKAFKQVKIKYRCGCLDSQATEGTFAIKAAELAAVFRE